MLQSIDLKEPVPQNSLTQAHKLLNIAQQAALQERCGLCC